MAHTDVVFPDEEELPLRVEEGRIYCPGVGDDTACLVSLLLAAKYIAGHVGSPGWKELRGPDAPGLVLVCNSGEEGLGNLKGVRKICQDYGSRMVSFCTFDSSLDSIVDSAVGSKRFRVCVKTRGGHSYNDFGRDNAIARLADIISRLYALQAPVEGGRTTYNVGMITGGTSVNTIAQQAEMLYEFRSESRENMDYMEKMFLDVIEQAKSEGADVSLEVIGLRPCGGDVDQEKERALVERAVRAVSGATGVKPELHSGSTDCNIPLSLGIPSVCVGSFTGSGAHTRDEYVEAASLEQGYKVAFEMILGRD
ncbi:MAG: M20/M25/M40 family metallo-hydrolase [Enterocloster aldenensis]|nr:M20/M25/M40 family metallo-hydrolase [Enterocloster aldenensis]MDY4532839.1 M20/M25/M40 family metallo-hydrolase [Enterocloster aldenensis]RHB45716.1 M20/M25/M40 family metallo-hydrolase [Enterocloster aldenensis]